MIVLVRITVEMIEQDSDIITAVDLMHINNNLRQRLQAQIDALRQAYALAEAAKSPVVTALYTNTTETAEAYARPPLILTAWCWR